MADLVASLSDSAQNINPCELSFDLDDAGWTFESGFSSVDENDVILVWIGTRNNTSTISGSGGSEAWTVDLDQKSTAGGAMQIGLLWYPVSASDVSTPPTYTIAGSAGFKHIMISVTVWRGADPSDPIDVSASEQDGLSTTATAPSLTTTADNEVVMACAGIASSTAMDADDLSNEIHNISPGVGCRMSVHSEMQATAGATGTEGFSAGSNQVWQLGRVALNNDTTPPPSTVRSVFPSPTMRRLRRRSGSR